MTTFRVFRWFGFTDHVYLPGPPSGKPVVYELAMCTQNADGVYFAYLPSRATANETQGASANPHTALSTQPALETDSEDLDGSSTDSGSDIDI